MPDGATTSLDERFGLSLRFDVTINGHDLGGWQQCNGLEVDYGLDTVREMGENTTVHNLLGQGTYPQLVLSRAMTARNWADTLAWLASLQVTPVAQQHATITLQDAWAGEVASWTLQNVLPVKWQGPTLSATASEVAVEKLTLAHEGFLGLSSPQTPARAYLTDDTGIVLSLQFNPQSLVKTQNNRLYGNSAYRRRSGQSVSGKGARSRGADPSNVGRAYGWSDYQQSTYSLSEVWFDSLDPSYGSPAGQPRSIASDIDLLFSWMEPRDTTGKPPVLAFWWGAFLQDPVLCHLSKSSVTYKRLAPDGTPQRVQLNLVLTEIPEEQPATNPTSGGPGGHRSRTIMADESLAAIAFQEYGSAGVWPLLAKFNDVDDPTRLRPGSTLLVPPLRILEGA